MEQPKPIHVLLWLMALVLVLWLAYWGLVVVGITGDGAEGKRGQFGDMFGAVNALFSAFTFAALIVTIISQNQQLREQRADIEKTREGQRKTDESLAKQAESLALSSAINAVNYRLHRYDVQIAALNEGPQGHLVKLWDGREGTRQEMADTIKQERYQLTVQLDALLRKAVAMAESK